MKALRLSSFLFALIVNALFISCAPSIESNEVPNALVAKPDTLTIKSLTDTVQTTLALNCGCGFSLLMSGLDGDIAKISALSVEALTDSSLGAHHVKFFAAT